MPAGTVELLRIQIQLTKDTDPNLRHALVMGLMGCASEKQLAGLAGHDSQHVQMAVLLIRRRNADPEVAEYLTSVGPRLVLEAVRAIHDVPIPAAMPFFPASRNRSRARAKAVRALLNSFRRRCRDPRPPSATAA